MYPVLVVLSVQPHTTINIHQNRFLHGHLPAKKTSDTVWWEGRGRRGGGEEEEGRSREESVKREDVRVGGWEGGREGGKREREHAVLQ